MKPDSKKCLTIFVCEFITAGGLNRVELPQSLVQEGSLMRDALLRDLSLLPNIQIVTTQDARLSSPLLGSVAIGHNEDVIHIWQNLLKDCDAAFIIAPETDGQLASLVALVNNAGVLHLGCGLSAVKLASSKYQTYQQLKKAGINVIPSYRFDKLPIENAVQPWVIKPDDGAGCAGTICLNSLVEVRQYLASKVQSQSIDNQIIQPFIKGVPASISMLCKAGQAWVLGCNLQKITLINNKFVYHGSVVNGLNMHYSAFNEIAQKIAQAIPDLAGYVGVDVMLNGDEITVLEINPRLTSSYVGLHDSTGLNVSKLILDLFFNSQLVMPAINFMHHQAVEITL